MKNKINLHSWKLKSPVSILAIAIVLNLLLFCTNKSKTITEDTGAPPNFAAPVTLRTVRDMRENFNWHYIENIDNPVNDEDLNIVSLFQIINNFSMKIEPGDQVEKWLLDINNNWKGKKEEGITFHFIVNNNNVFSYALQKSDYNFKSDVLEPIYYIQNRELVKYDKDLVKFNGEISDYNNKVKIYINKENKVYVKDIMYEMTVSTPYRYKCFYSFDELYNLILDNYWKTAKKFETESLYIFNGAIFYPIKDPKEKNIKFQIPILSTMPLANLTDMQVHEFPYKYKALDIGKLCPPDCK